MSKHHTQSSLIMALTCALILFMTTGCEDSGENANAAAKSKQMLALDTVALDTVALDTKALDTEALDTEAGSAIDPKATNNISSSSSMKAYRDPTTGQYTSKPAMNESSVNNEGSENKDETESSNASLRSLTQPTIFEERPSDIEGGGMVIDLKGHFRQSLQEVRPQDSQTGQDPIPET